MLKVMQIGYGYWGNNVAQKLIVSKIFDFVCLAEVDADKRKKAKNKLPNTVEIIDDYRTKLMSDIDAVIVCTQTKYSYQIIIDAINSGKHVFTEKPLSTNVVNAESLINCSRKNNRILHCDHLMVYNPVIRYIKKMIDNNEIGDIMYIDISRVNLGIVRKDINAMLDLAVHDIAVIDYLTGGLEPDYLSAVGTGFYGKQETITYLSMRCGDLLVNINSSWLSPVKVRKTVIAGTKKMLIFDDVKQSEKLAIYDSGIEIAPSDVYGEYEYKTRVGDVYIPHIEFEDSLLNSIEHFGECILQKKESLSGPEQSLRVMKVLEAAQDSLRKRYSTD